ncbi:hypothetical protein [Legionella saoudiensis]|uniref:hypothetical protein n=1 Tax=Legionella saoudiensis TaxID=1750561 RepID=UPI000730CBE5|nr:hypothetical protein [Legionella saoudiensis]
MSATSTLTEFYGSFFSTCGHIARGPYTLITQAFIGQDPEPEDHILGFAACIIFSTILPILPQMLIASFSLSCCLAIGAILTMPFTYTAAAYMDAQEDNTSSMYRF